MSVYNKRIIYLDNAATTWLKPKEVKSSIDKYFNKFYGSPYRTNESINIIDKIRNQAAEYFGVDDSKYVAFVPSATIGMNLVLNSLLSPGDHAITTNCEHHCVYRPLCNLTKAGVTYDIAEYVDNNHNEFPENIFKLIKPNTKLVIINHGSNVTGAVFNVGIIGRELKKLGIKLVVDVSQTAGMEDVSISNLYADVLITSAHKHLYGIQGIGLIVYHKDVHLKPLYFGGTGRNSGMLEQPAILPDMLEAGTVNLPAILALEASMNYFNKDKRSEVRGYVEGLINYFMDSCSEIPGMQLYSRKFGKRTGTVSFNIKGLDPCFVVAPYLAKKGNIYIRSGLHCAPYIHRTLQTYPEGTNRLSVSIFTTKKDILRTLEILKSLGRESNHV